MIRTYENPNTCYAIGDCFSVILGTEITNRQPSSGVFEQLSSIAKTQTSANNEPVLYNGSVTKIIYSTITETMSESNLGASLYHSPNNLAIVFGNTVYLRKQGTADTIGFSGVQVDA